MGDAAQLAEEPPKFIEPVFFAKEAGDQGIGMEACTGEAFEDLFPSVVSGHEAFPLGFFQLFPHALVQQVAWALGGELLLLGLGLLHFLFGVFDLGQGSMGGSHGTGAHSGQARSAEAGAGAFGLGLAVAARR